MIDVPTIVSFFGFAVAVLAVSVAYFTRRQVIAAARFVQGQNKSSISLRKMAEVEASLSELTDAYDALLTSHKKLRSRIGMRRVRDQRKQDEIPDPATDPAGYKKAMRLKMNNRR